MARIILVMGKTGNGKSRSIKNLNPKKTAIINCIGKDLPFKGWKDNYKLRDFESQTGNMWITHESSTICTILKGIAAKMPEIEEIIVDDLQSVMSYEYMARALEGGWGKFSEMGQNLFNVFKTAQSLPAHLTVIFLTHTEQDEYGNDVKMKTIGKMVDEKLTPEGLFTIVLIAVSQKEENEYKYYFRTNGTPAKSPEGMFPLLIENDLDYVLKTIKEYERN